MNKYLSKFKVLVTSAFVNLGLVFVSVPTLAQDNQQSGSGGSLAEQAQQGVNAAGGGQNTTDFGEVIVDVINFMLFAIGILAVIMVIVGGIRYVLSAGDSNATQGARNTILYAIIGLVVAFVAWGLVNFVAQTLTTP